MFDFHAFISGRVGDQHPGFFRCKINWTWWNVSGFFVNLYTVLAQDDASFPFILNECFGTSWLLNITRSSHEKNHLKPLSFRIWLGNPQGLRRWVASPCKTWTSQKKQVALPLLEASNSFGLSYIIISVEVWGWKSWASNQQTCSISII